MDYLSIFIANLNMQGFLWVLYLAYCGMSLMQIGLLEGIYHATSMIFEVPSGAAADLLGRKRSMLVSRVCITISCIIMLVSKSFRPFAFSFILQAIATVAGGILAEYSYFWCYAVCVLISLLAFIPVLFMTEPPVMESVVYFHDNGISFDGICGCMESKKRVT